MKKRKDILHSDSCGVIPTAKGFRLLDAGFFYIMKKSNEVSTVVELSESILEWVESRSRALNTTPGKLIVAAIALAKKRDEEGGAR